MHLHNPPDDSLRHLITKMMTFVAHFPQLFSNLHSDVNRGRGLVGARGGQERRGNGQKEGGREGEEGQRGEEERRDWAGKEC